MKCKTCVENGMRSVVYPGVMTTTDMYFQPFYDEDGKYHNHDFNARTQEYSCDNGHKWSEQLPPPDCPTCGPLIRREKE